MSGSGRGQERRYQVVMRWKDRYDTKSKTVTVWATDTHRASREAMAAAPSGWGRPTGTSVTAL